MTVKYTYSQARRAMVPYQMRDGVEPSFGDTFTTAQWFWLATLVAVGTILVSLLMYAAISHAIHPDCASVLACVRL